MVVVWGGQSDSLICHFNAALDRTEEMRPRWFAIESGREDSIPFDMMVSAASPHATSSCLRARATLHQDSELTNSPEFPASQWPEARLYLPRLLTAADTDASDRRARVYGRADYRDHVETSQSMTRDVSSSGEDCDGMTAWWIAST